MPRRSFGSIKKMRSGRFQASYVHPPTVGKRHLSPRTFQTKKDADAWLRAEATLISTGDWTPPLVRAERAAAAAVERQVLTFGGFAIAWLEGRLDVRASTKTNYQWALERHLIPTFGPMTLEEIDGPAVRAWYASYGAKTPAARTHAYSLLRQIMDAAVTDELIDRNPCNVRGGTKARTAHDPDVLTLAELLKLAGEMPERHRALTLLCGLCGLRFGEAVALRRRDVDLAKGTVRITRTYVRDGNSKTTGPPKTAAGRRTVHMPQLVVDAMRAHLRDTPITGGRDSLVFPGANGELLAPSALYGRAPRIERRKSKGGAVREFSKGGYGFFRARAVIGHPSMHWHDLRHTAATLGAQAGASVREMQARLGHSTADMALAYQGASADRDRSIADRLQEQVDAIQSKV